MAGTSSQAKTKGWIKNLVTGSTASFDLNPETFSRGRSAEFIEFTSPFSPYPLVQYVGGNSIDITLDLFFFDKPPTGAIKKFRDFLDDLLPPEVFKSSFKKPPKVLFCYGGFVKTCVLTEYNMKVDDYSTSGIEQIATFSITLKQLGE